MHLQIASPGVLIPGCKLQYIMRIFAAGMIPQISSPYDALQRLTSSGLSTMNSQSSGIWLKEKERSRKIFCRCSIGLLVKADPFFRGDVERRPLRSLSDASWRNSSWYLSRTVWTWARITSSSCFMRSFLSWSNNRWARSIARSHGASKAGSTYSPGLVIPIWVLYCCRAEVRNFWNSAIWWSYFFLPSSLRWSIINLICLNSPWRFGGILNGDLSKREPFHSGSWPRCTSVFSRQERWPINATHLGTSNDPCSVQLAWLSSLSYYCLIQHRTLTMQANVREYWGQV